MPSSRAGMVSEAQPGHVEVHMCRSPEGKAHVESEIPSRSRWRSPGWGCRWGGGRDHLSALSFGCFITPRFLKCEKEGGKKHPLHFLAPNLLSVFPLPRHGPRESPLPSSALPAHLELFVSPQLQSLKKGFRMNQGIS